VASPPSAGRNQRLRLGGASAEWLGTIEATDKRAAELMGPLAGGVM
jgi:hypothetical protein